ncbi:MAG TPA: hypothetical protein VNI61_07715 [Gemmatimonadales bacterium]|nr:hypothetical protein [Gemmatimonadales bacterium]
MLSELPTPERPFRPGARPLPSLRQAYQEFLLERVEEYKNSLTREELLEIGDEAVRELEASAQGQYILTEVLVLEHVDRIIARRLKLPTFRRWVQKHRALRQAQREPTHWGLAPSHPLVTWARRRDGGDGGEGGDGGDVAVVVGAGATAEAMFLAAHEVRVFFLDQELHAVEAAEQRAVTEQLGARFEALVIRFGSWFPDVLTSLAVIAPAALAAARVKDRQALLRDLQARTRPGGLHVVLGAGERPQVLSLASGALHTAYVQAGWAIERRRGKRDGAFVATKPPRHADTVLNVSE